jgi:hypothetical protein
MAWPGMRRNGWRNGLVRAHSHHLHRVRLDRWHGMILTAQRVLDELLLARGTRRMI